MNVMLPASEALPGANLIQQGVLDLTAGRESVEALLVSVGAPRLRSLDIDIPTPISSPEHKLYLLLALEKGDAAHSAYNALIRRLVSFEHAAARQMSTSSSSPTAMRFCERFRGSRRR
jgi:hypothetical protein